MKLNHIFKWLVLCAVVSAFLVAPALGQAKKEEMAKFKEQRAAMIKQLKLPADKEKAVLAVEDKYSAQREGIIDELKKNREALETALKAPKPDETKVKDLVNAIYTDMDKMLSSFKSQRDEEMAQMTAVEQGKYLVAMMKWRHEMHSKAGAGKKAPPAATTGPKKKTAQ